MLNFPEKGGLSITVVHQYHHLQQGSDLDGLKNCDLQKYITKEAHKQVIKQKTKYISLSACLSELYFDNLELKALDFGFHWRVEQAYNGHSNAIP